MKQMQRLLITTQAHRTSIIDFNNDPKHTVFIGSVVSG
ncbi:hypothetical protein VCHENC01_3904 [Vibrio harveyi]|nr:hypothetical protein VCHENC01_3904 [Vibrio harveyi]